LPVILAESLPKAITEPENVTAPISTPRIHLHFVDRLLGGRHADRHGRIDEIGVADEHRGRPTRLCISATSSGICVILTMRAA
jgi:hypothetical protein